jgi:gluconate 2-dehydrogenase gamma chain
MDRRDLLHALGATAALAFVPRTAEGAVAFVERLQQRVAQPGAFRTLNASHQALVTRVCDLVLPRTDTPGALDVKVPELIDLLLTEWYDPTDRQALLANLDAMNRVETERGSVTFPSLPIGEQSRILTALDARRDDKSGAAAAFRELKSLTVFGYFTSEQVTKDVLQTRMVFPRYQGDAPVAS